MTALEMIFLLSLCLTASSAATFLCCCFYFNRRNFRDQKIRRADKRANVRMKREINDLTANTIAAAKREIGETILAAQTAFELMNAELTERLNDALEKQYANLDSVAKVVYEMQHPTEQAKNRLNYLSKEEREKRYIQKNNLKVQAKVG